MKKNSKILLSSGVLVLKTSEKLFVGFLLHHQNAALELG